MTAVPAYIKVDGVDGESTSKDHKGEIEVLSWNWGITSSGSSTTGSGAGAGKARLHEIRFVHLYDVASPKLAESTATGRHIKEASLAANRPGAHQVDFLKVSMKEVFITEVNVSSDGDTVSEEIALQPGWIRFDYATQSPSGAIGTTSSFTWDAHDGKEG